jgi:Tetratricopeptide repeat
LRAGLTDRGGGITLGTILSQDCVLVELLASDPVAAVELGEKGCRLLDEFGEKGFLSTSAGNLARALYALDRLEDADVWARRGAELGASDDVTTQMLWRQVRAKVLARRGEDEEAERVARKAVAIGDRPT